MNFCLNSQRTFIRKKFRSANTELFFQKNRDFQLKKAEIEFSKLKIKDNEENNSSTEVFLIIDQLIDSLLKKKLEINLNDFIYKIEILYNHFENLNELDSETMNKFLTCFKIIIKETNLIVKNEFLLQVCLNFLILND